METEIPTGTSPLHPKPVPAQFPVGEFPAGGGLAVDWAVAAQEFRSREFGALRRAVTSLSGPTADKLPELFDPSVSDEAWHPAAGSVLRQAFDEAATIPGALPVVAAYIYGLCQKRWEHSTDHHSILRTANGAAHVFNTMFPDATGVETDDHQLARLLLDLGVSLGSCMAAENALNCSCPVDMMRHAAQAAAVGRRVVDECRTHQGAHSTDGYAFVSAVSAGQQVYFDALERVGAAVRTFIDHRGDSAEVLRDAIGAISAAERGDALRGDVYESELRAHRITLERMESLLGAPAIQVDEGRIFYCYPFAVLGMNSAEVIARLLELSGGARIGRTSVLDVGELDVTDAWEVTDSGERSYRAVGLTLPDLTITTTAGETLAAHEVQLRATTIGTCYLRVATQLRDLSAHGLNQAMRRGSVYMGTEQIRDGSSPNLESPELESPDLESPRLDSSHLDSPHLDSQWGQLSEYAQEMIEAVGEFIARDRPHARVVVSVQRRQHTILSIRKLSLVSPSGVRRDADFEEAQSALGARLLDQRINYASATLEEYVRIPRHDPATVIDDVGFEGEVIVRNAESTIIVMPTTPNFIALYYEDLAEFSASLPALVDQWTTAITEQRHDLKAQLPRFEAVWSGGRLGRKQNAALAKDLRELERRQNSLQEAVGDAQAMLAFVRSSEICQSVKYRQILDQLFEGADIPRLERDFDAQVAQVDALYLHVQALARRLDERDQRRYRLLVEVTLAFLAVTSLADFFALVNAAFAQRGIFVEVGAVLAVGLLVVAVAVRSFGRGRKH
jgi:hypothetical protein